MPPAGTALTIERLREAAEHVQPPSDAEALDQMAALFRVDQLAGADGVYEVWRVVAATGRDVTIDPDVEVP